MKKYTQVQAKLKKQLNLKQSRPKRLQFKEWPEIFRICFENTKKNSNFIQVKYLTL